MTTVFFISSLSKDEFVALLLLPKAPNSSLLTGR